MLISDEYRDLNRQLHETRKDYGVGGYRWASDIRLWTHKTAL
jgi:hypothetical protein